MRTDKIGICSPDDLYSSWDNKIEKKGTERIFTNQI